MKPTPTVMTPATTMLARTAADTTASSNPQNVTRAKADRSSCSAARRTAASTKPSERSDGDWY